MLSKSHRQFIAALESVESRFHLTAATVMGTNQADEIRMEIASNGSGILVEVNGFTSSYPFFVYNSVSIEGSGGADKIYIDTNDGAPVTVNAGSGNDEIYLAEASTNLDDLPDPVVLVASGPDRLFLHDDAASFADTYSVNNSHVGRPGFGGVTHNGVASIKITSGAGADTFDVVNTNGATLIVDGQAGADVLNANAFGGGAAEVAFENDQDFAKVTSEPGGNLTLLGSAGLLVTTNQSNFEGNVTLGTGYLIERNSQVAGGLGYWRGRLINGNNAVTPSIKSSFATDSALGDAVGYAYAQNLTFGTLNGITLNSGDFVMRYTLKGDASLDRTVGFEDLVSLAQNYNGTQREWWQGDFDLSRVVDFADLVFLAQNYNATAPSIVATSAVAAKKLVGPRSAAKDVLA